MLRASLILFFLFSFIECLVAGSGSSNSTANAIKFIENKGQWKEPFLFKAGIPGGDLYLEKDRFTFSLYDKVHSHYDAKTNGRSTNSSHNDDLVKAHAFQVIFNGSSLPAFPEKLDVYPFHNNYFLGNDKDQWKSNVPIAAKVRYKKFYKGIDMQVYSEKSAVKYEFIVDPGADPEQINLTYKGLDKIYLKNGNLHLATSLGEVLEQKPYCYQVIGGKQVEVPSRYVLNDANVVFDFPQGYDKSKTLIIDPVLIFASFSGSTADNFGFTATYDAAGNLYAGGIAFSAGYPFTTGAYQAFFGGGKVDMAISKFSSSGSTLLYSTYLGGAEVDAPHSLVVNSSNELFILGTTGSLDYPVTGSAFQKSFKGGTVSNTGSGYTYSRGSDMVVSRLSADGTQLLASTYFGGSKNDGLNESVSLKKNYGDEFRGEIIVDAGSNCYISSTTSSSDFPVLNSVQSTFGGGNQDACLFKLTADLTSVEWSTYLGGTGDDAAYSVQLNKNGEPYITGGTSSTNFTITAGVIKSFYSGNVDGFLTRFSSSGNKILSSTYIGTGDYNQCYFVQLDDLDNVYVLGQTKGSYPIKAGPSGSLYQNANSGQFIHKLNADLTATVFSTVFGTGSSSPDISPSAFLVTNCSQIYVSGWGGMVNGGFIGGSTTGLPVTADALQPTTDGSDFYLIVLSQNAESLVYGTFIGGNGPVGEHVDGGTSRFDKNGIVYQAVCGGCGSSSDFPVTPGVWSPTNNSTNCNTAVIKFDVSDFNAIIDNSGPTWACVNSSVTLTNKSTGNNSYIWDFGDGTFSTSFNGTHTYTDTGTYTIKLIAFNTTSCIPSDTTFLFLEVKGPPVAKVAPVYKGCEASTVQLSASGGITYSWLPATGLNNAFISNPVAVINATPVNYSVIVTGLCGTDTGYTKVMRFENPLIVSPDDSICKGDTTQLFAVGAKSYSWSNGSSLSATNIFNPKAFPTETSAYIVTAIDTNNCVFKDTVIISMKTPPVAIPLIDSLTPPCMNEVVNFKNLSIGGTSFLWSFGNGATSSAFNPSHIFTATGNYTIELIVTDTNRCNYSDTTQMDIFVKSVPVAFVSADSIICPGDSVQLLATGGDTYKWIASSNLSNDTISNPMAYYSQFISTYVVEAFNECGSDTASVVVNPIQFSVTVSKGDTICRGTSINLFASGGKNYLWSPLIGLSSNAVANPVATPLLTTSYVVTVTDSNNCILADSILIVVDSAETAKALSDTVICRGDSVQLFATGGRFYSWSPSLGLSSDTSSSPFAFPLATTSYVLTAKNSCGSTVDTVTIKVTFVPLLNIPDAKICTGDTITLSSPAGYIYSWAPLTNIIGKNSNAPLVWPEENTTYTVIVKDTMGCVRMDTVNVTVNLLPDVDAGPDKIIDFGESASLNATGTAATYSWSPNVFLSCVDCPSTLVSPAGTTVYYVTGTDKNKCKATDSVTVKLHGSLYIPNTFTPDGDGLNDVFYAYGKEIVEFNIMIFNRWGELIFTSDDITKGWDGTYKGEPVAIDTFVWKLTYSERAGRKGSAAGHVNVLR